VIERWEHEDVLDDVKGRMRANPSMMSVRKSVVEHVFGSIKRPFDMGYLLLRGFSKVWGEVGLALLAYNLRRALNLLGPGSLIQALASFS
jgi:hypothetical protein